MQQTEEHARQSPFLDPFKGTDVPVLIITNHIDEVCFKNVGEYKGKKFVNIETNFEEIAKDVDKRVEVDKDKGLPEDDTTTFCLWVKSELEPRVSRVTLSRRLSNAPAVLVGQVSSSMRAILSMVDQSQFEQASRDQTLEINPNHPIIVKINQLRKA